MGWIREEEVIISCNPVRDLDAETTGETPKVHLYWNEPEAGSTGNLLGYRIQKDGELLTDTLVEETEWRDNEVDFNEMHEYVVIAIFDDGCEAESEPLSVTVTWDAIQENGKEIKIYPNPAKETLHIEGIDILQVELFNIVGQKVSSIDANFNAIKLDQLPSGLYFVRIQSKQGEQNLKILIEK